MSVELQMKIKTHKCQGKIFPRALHSLPIYGLESFSKWFAGVLRDQLVEHPNLVQNAEVANRRLEGVRLHGDEVFLRLDLEDYLSSGYRHQL